MTTVKFTGFRTGRSVTIDGVNAPAWAMLPGGTSVWDQPTSAGCTATISIMRSPHQVAPEAAFCSVVTTGFDDNTMANESVADPSRILHDYYWDFGETYTYTAPTQVAAVDESDSGQRTNSRYMTGFIAGHVYRTHTTVFTIRLAVRERSSGKWAQASRTFSTGNPDVFYAGSATLFVDLNGSGGGYPNSPTGAVNYSTFGPAFTALVASATPKRIVLQRGQTHALSGTYNFEPPTAGRSTSFRIEASSGAGAKPILLTTQGYVGSGGANDFFRDRSTTASGGALAGGLHSQTFVNLDIRGTWDVTTESGGANLTNLLNIAEFSAEYNLQDRCEFSRAYRGITHGKGAAEYDHIRAVCDTYIHDWRDYGMFGDRCIHMILGSRIDQNPLALAGERNDGGNNSGNRRFDRNNHGPVRYANNYKVIHAATSFFSANGWSTVGGNSDVDQQFMQPCIRWHTSGNNAGAQSILSDCVLESAGTPFNPASAEATANNNVANTVVERNILFGGHQSPSFILTTTAPMRIENNIFILPGTPVDRGINSFVRGHDEGIENTGVNALPVYIWNNDCINLRSTGGQVAVWSTAGRLMGQQLLNNLVHEPNLDSPNVPCAPLTALPLFTPKYQGYRDGDPTALITNRAPGLTDPARYIPQAGSSALTGGVQTIGAKGFKEGYDV